MGHMLLALIRGLVIVLFSGFAAFYGGSIAYQIVHGSLGFGVVAWIYGAFMFLVGFLFASVGGHRRYTWIAVTMIPIFMMLLLILTSSFRDAGSFSSGDFTDFLLFLLFGSVLLALGIGLGTLARRALGRIMPPSVWNQL